MPAAVDVVVVAVAATEEGIAAAGLVVGTSAAAAPVAAGQRVHFAGTASPPLAWGRQSWLPP